MILAATKAAADGTNSVQLLLLVGGITLVPALLFTVTGFTRILVVLGFIRQGLGTQAAPPNQVLVGIALFLTIFVMAPTFKQIKTDAIDPLQKHKITQAQAFERGQQPLREFMFRQTRTTDLALFVKLGKVKNVKTRKDIPTYVLIPAFIISELKTAFQIGFLIFLPFLVIGLAVSVFQAVTQIQEQTLSFIPKILALAGVLIVAGPWMLGQLLSYTTDLWSSIPNLIG
jgi:flagellar biosynthetic protein FliP